MRWTVSPSRRGTPLVLPDLEVSQSHNRCVAAAAEWDVLLIGGGGVVGKSHVAQGLARRLGIDSLQADDVRLLLQRAVPASMEPALHFFLTADVRSVELTEALAAQDEIARYVSHKLEVVIAHHVATHRPLIIEGDAIVPELAATDSHAGQATGGRVRAIFIEEPDEAVVYRDLRKRARGNASEAAERLWARFHHAHGQELAESAHRYGIPVIAARPRRTLQARALDALSEQAATG